MSSNQQVFELSGFDTRIPVVAAAIHDGHELRQDLLSWTALTEGERLREEDPHTSSFAQALQGRIIVRASRFQMDLNRPPEQAVYRGPEDAWGLKVWNNTLPDDLAARSMADYHAFYSEIEKGLRELEQRFGHFVVLDLHSYNHRRAGPDQPPADPETNPQVNVGTQSVDRELWGPLVERFVDDLRGFDFPAGGLDVRENVKFFGGNFPRWIHRTFPRTGCALALEFKKFFMDEWTHQVNETLVEAIQKAIASTVPGLIEELERLSASRR